MTPGPMAAKLKTTGGGPAGEEGQILAIRFRVLLLIALCLTLAAGGFVQAHAEPFGRIFWHLLTVQDLPAAWSMVAMLAVCVFWAYSDCGRDHSPAEGFLLAIERYRHPIATALWGLLCLGTLNVYRDHPLSMDEYAALFQAKIFAGGQMHGVFPADLLDQLLPKNFQNHFLMVNRSSGAVWSAYSPGFSLLLAPFALLGAPWACNPTLVAVSFLLVGRVVRDLTGSSQAVGCALLFALASPAFVANGISYYSMPAHLLLNIAYAWSLFSVSPVRLLLAGFCGGWALMLHNPFPHAVFAAPWVLWLMFRSERRFSDLLWLAAGYAPVVCVLGIGWALWQQHAMSVVTIAVAAGFPAGGASGAEGVGNALARMVRGAVRWIQMPDDSMLESRVAGLIKLWLWSAPAMLLLAWLGGRRASDVRLRLLGASALLTFFAYFFIPFDQGHGWGYRYFHSAWAVLPVFAALGAAKLHRAEGGKVVRQLVVLTVFGLVFANALRLWQIGEFVSAHLAQYPERSSAERQLVLHSGRGYYALDLIQNDPWLSRGDVVILVPPSDQGRAALIERIGARDVSARNRFGSSEELTPEILERLRRP